MKNFIASGLCCFYWNISWGKIFDNVRNSVKVFVPEVIHYICLASTLAFYHAGPPRDIREFLGAEKELKRPHKIWTTMQYKGIFADISTLTGCYIGNKIHCRLPTWVMSGSANSFLSILFWLPLMMARCPLCEIRNNRDNLRHSRPTRDVGIWQWFGLYQ